MTKKLSDKDKKDWQNFLENSEKLDNKDKETLDHHNRIGEKVVDLHGFTLEEANQKVSEFIQDCYDQNVIKINIITGKGGLALARLPTSRLSTVTAASIDS